MRMPRTAVVLAILATFGARAFAGEGEARIHAPEDDLPSATVGGYRIDFARNGACVVSRDGRNLFDMGLVYAMPGWKEWGTQRRRSGREDGWELDPADPASLLSHGTLFGFDGTERFRFTQKTSVMSGGVRLAYSITPLAERKLGEFGLVLHFPVLQTKGADAEFWPGFGELILPESRKSARLYRGNARAAHVFLADSFGVQAVAGKPLLWTLLDDRAWQLNTYRFIGSDRQLTTALSKGEKADFTFDLLLGDRACKDLPLGKGRLTIDPYGRIAIHASGKKLAEGGLKLKARRPGRWLYETAQPAAAMPDGMISGTAGGPGTDWGYDVQGTVENGLALLALRAHKAGGEARQDDTQFALAVPSSEVEAPPTTAAPGAETAPDAPGSSRKPGQHRITVAFKDGLVLELEAEVPWEVRKTDVFRQECFLLSVPIGEVGEGEDKAAVRIGVRLTSDTEPTGART